MSSTSDRSFLDTNVLVYAVDRADAGKYDRARGLIRAARPGELVISAQVLSEFYVVVTRKLANPLSDADAAAAVGELSKLPTVASDGELVRRGIGISRDHQISFWDALIVAAARAGACGQLLTEDLSHGASIASVLVENPFR